MLTIISFNCDGRLTNWLGLGEIIATSKPDIIALQDPPNLGSPAIKTNIMNNFNSNYHLIHHDKIAIIINTAKIDTHNITRSDDHKAQAISTNIRILST